MTQSDGGDEAARAFEDLRGEVTLLRRAVERLAAERAGDSDAPDYSETLGFITQNLSVTAQRVDMLLKSPVLSLTPEETGRQIEAASFTARREDHRLLLTARQALEEIAARLGRHLQSDIGAAMQRRRLWHVGVAALVAGMVLWVTLAGPVARSLPASWLLPERMAARLLHLPMWDGGQRLMRAADAPAFAGVLADHQLATANRKALAACRQQAAKTDRAVRCMIKVGMERTQALPVT